MDGLLRANPRAGAFSAHVSGSPFSCTTGASTVVRTSSSPAMPSSTFYVFSQRLLSPKSVALGRLVIDSHAPWEDFCPYTLRLTDDDVATVAEPRLREIIEHTRGTQLHEDLSKLFHFVMGDDNPEVIHSASEKTYLLLNQGDYFKRACADSNTRKWFETVIRHGWKVYMVVAIHTIHESSIHPQSLEQRLQAPDVDDVRTQAPGLTVPGAGLTVCPEPTPAAPAIPSNQLIIAVQYRKVQFKWYSSRKVDRAFLERGSNRWKVFVISGRDTDEVYDDIVEADLQESLVKEDVEEEDEEQGDIFTTSDDTLVIFDS
jgi:hypothetical protein